MWVLGGLIRLCPVLQSEGGAPRFPVRLWGPSGAWEAGLTPRAVPWAPGPAYWPSSAWDSGATSCVLNSATPDMEFLEVLTEGLDRVLLVRGSGREVVTIYS